MADSINSMPGRMIGPGILPPSPAPTVFGPPPVERPCFDFDIDIEKLVKTAPPSKAPDFCRRAAELMEERGKSRDKPSGERSMSRCVDAFNAMTGHNLSVEDGWMFMIYLKHARMRAGAFNRDDYEDAVAYAALMAEEATPEC